MCVNKIYCIVLFLFSLFFLVSCCPCRIKVIDQNGQSVPNAILVIREQSMFKPKKIQKSSFYVTDENGLVTIKESPTFILSCGKVGYWAASDYIEEKKGDFLVTLMYATPENSKCIYGTINVDDMRGKDLYDQWQSYLDWQKKELRKIQR